MKAIFASKLYKASPRKDKIKAALNNPVNEELVGQLAEYLDEDYRPQPELDISDMPDSDNPKSSDSEEPKASRLSGGSSYGGGHPSGDGMVFEDKGEEVNDGSESDVPNEDSESIETDDGPLELGNDIPDEDVETSTDIEVEQELFTDRDVAGVRNLLENDPETLGVDRILAREDEVWLYYEDNINLNKVMSAVIEKVESSEWNNLEFNRLARSSNAIVFQIREK